jgi:hypothetical protein
VKAGDKQCSVPPKRLLTFNELHGVISQKIVLFVDQHVCFPTEGYNFSFINITVIKFAAQEPRIESYQIAEEYNLQERIARHIFMSSVRSRYVECLIISYKSFIYTLKSRVSRVDSCGTPESTWKGDEIVPEIWTRDCLSVR